MIARVAAGASFGAADLPEKKTAGSFFLTRSWGAGGSRWGRLDGDLCRGLDDGRDDGLGPALLGAALALTCF